MLSELSRGDCSWDGTLNLYQNVQPSILKRDGIKSSCSRRLQFRPLTCLPRKSRAHTARRPPQPTVLQGEDNQLVLPKTYLTRTGDLVLFTVFDDELFALVDSSFHTKSSSLLGGLFYNDDDGIESLSRFRTLEDFVISVLDYKHEEEKYLYASAHKKLVKRQYTATGKGRPENQDNKNETIGKVIAPELPLIRLDDSKEITTNSSLNRPTEHHNDQGKEINSLKQTQEYVEDLSLATTSPPRREVRSSRQLRSAQLDRSGIQKTDNAPSTPKEYIDFCHPATPKGQRQNSPVDDYRFPLTTAMNYERSASTSLTRMLGENQVTDNLIPGAGIAASQQESAALVPNSVRYILDNWNKTEDGPQNSPDLAAAAQQATSMRIPLNRPRREVASAVDANITGINTVMPFMYDGKMGESNSKSLERDVKRTGDGKVQSTRDAVRRGCSALNVERLHSATLRESVNVNLHPRISSARPAPEFRALGVTPSAIQLNKNEFQRLLDVTKNNFSSGSNHQISFELNGSIMIHDQQDIVQQYARESAKDDAEEWADLAGNANNSVYGCDGAAQFSRSEACDSAVSLRSEDFDNGEDKILFSRIQSRLNTGSWNPTVSVSYADNAPDDSSEPCSEDYKNEKQIANSRKRGEVASRERKSPSPGVQSFRTKGITPVPSLNFDDAGNATQSRLLSMSNEGRLQSDSRRNSSDSFQIRQTLGLHGGLSRATSLESCYRPVSPMVSRASSARDYDDEAISVRSLTPVPRLQAPRNESTREKEFLRSTENAASSLYKGTSNKELLANRSSSRSKSGVTAVPQNNLGRDFMSEDKLGGSETEVYELELNKSQMDDSESLHQSFNKESTFTSNTGTNVSITNSIPDHNIVHLSSTDLAAIHQIPDCGSSEAEVEKYQQLRAGVIAEEQSRKASNDNNEKTIGNHEDISIAENRCDDTANMQPSGTSMQSASCGVTVDNKPVMMLINDAKEAIEVDIGLENRPDLLINDDRIKQRTQLNEDRVFIESDVFGTKQMLSGDKQETLTTLQNNHNGDSALMNAIMQGPLSCEQQPAHGGNAGQQPPGIALLQYNDTGSIKDKTSGQKSKDAMLYQRQQQELRAKLADQDSLRLEGIGGEDKKVEKSELDELKMLLQSNNKNLDLSKRRKSANRVGRKKTTTPKSDAKKDQNKSSTVAASGRTVRSGLKHKAVTVETPSVSLIESHDVVPLSDKTGSYAGKVAYQEQATELEGEEQQQTQLPIHNFEVKKVAEMDPEKQGAYPPSKPKKGNRKIKKSALKKPTSAQKGTSVEDRLKYEEQMRMLKEKEMEQQRARETAMAKQKALEEERVRFEEEEASAKKKEEEARTKLSEAKLKAKEEREMKRLVDAEKRRQLVEQRREERRQKEVEIAKKEKDAERLKYERKRRAAELREERERLQEQQRLEEEELLEMEKQETQRREEEEKRLEEERIRQAQEELEKLVEEREYREQLRRVAEAQQAKLREEEEQRMLAEQREKQRISEERERLKRAEFLKLQAELERQKEAEQIAEGHRRAAAQRVAKRKAELLKRREANLNRMFDLKCKRESQGLTRAFTFTYFVHIPRRVWELPIGWNKKKSSNRRPTSTATSAGSRKIK